LVARYWKAKKLTPANFKAQLKKSVDPKFRAFLEGDLGARLGAILTDAQGGHAELHAALYELGDEKLEDALIAVAAHLHLILANGADKSGDGNAAARQHLNDKGVPTIDRLLKSKGLGHNKFVVRSDTGGPRALWTLMVRPGKQGVHAPAGERANEKDIYARGVVSTLGNEPGDSDKNVLDVRLVSSDTKFTPDRYTIVQPQGIDVALGPWIGEV